MVRWISESEILNVQYRRRTMRLIESWRKVVKQSLICSKSMLYWNCFSRCLVLFLRSLWDIWIWLHIYSLVFQWSPKVETSERLLEVDDLAEFSRPTLDSVLQDGRGQGVNFSWRCSQQELSLSRGAGIQVPKFDPHWSRSRFLLSYLWIVFKVIKLQR